MNDTRPALVCLHGLGLSGRLFDHVRPLVADDLRILTPDLPGFGDEPAPPGSLLDAAIALVEERLRALDGAPYLLAGHSMGGKVATLVTSRALTGVSGVQAPAGVVLLAASPPDPEPMSDEAREQMLGFARGDAISRDDARTFVDDNIAAPLAAAVDARIVADVTRSAPAAWRSWLTEGSLRDCTPGLRTTAGLGTLDVPAVVAAGAADGPLGETAQRRLNLPRYPRGRLAVVDGAAHLLPVERPDAVAGLIRSLLPALR
ncbi:alpha/beta fold hydrolase [Frondihabitans australicus]|uniref:Pimeloyl-ACP methyl ester carboxylesterase n=1 Tax=Frondihabitans australicus TaxID=386892 RepID=A0A495IDK7_9MICO|nr:alpha/beta fold hydrolase [Frondihabitans australicus]RKR73401.1 pimeloyl-ACP methyl ester carboxylesterase [Frondihabitans australicus]